MSFKDFQKRLIGMTTNACATEMDPAKAATTYKAFLQAMLKNFAWSFEQGLLVPENLGAAPGKTLKELEININKEAQDGYLICTEGEHYAYRTTKVAISGNAIVHAYDDVHVFAKGKGTIILHGKARAYIFGDFDIKLYDTASAHLTSGYSKVQCLGKNFVGCKRGTASVINNGQSKVMKFTK